MNYRDFFTYDNGKLFWKPRGESEFSSSRSYKLHMRYAGKEAGSLGKNGYIYVRVNGVPQLAHRVVWAIHHGEMPNYEIDHIDRDRLNNRIENLRLATSSENKWNMSIPSHNTSGRKGVSLHKPTGRYASYIKIDGKKRHIGYFSTLDAASEAYIKEAERLFLDRGTDGR